MSGESSTISCNCGARYQRTPVLLPIKDVGEFTCTVCGHTIERWRGRLVPKFKQLASAETRTRNAG